MTPAPPSRSRSGEARRERRSRETRPLLRALLKRWSMSRGDQRIGVIRALAGGQPGKFHSFGLFVKTEQPPVIFRATISGTSLLARRPRCALSGSDGSQMREAGRHRASVGVKIDHGPAAL